MKFSPKLWDAWLKRNAVDEQTLQLRKGIEEFRRMLDGREPVEFDLVARRK